MKKVLSVLILVCLLFGLCLAEDTETYWVLCNPDSFVYIRLFPKKNAQEDGYLYYGDSVEFDGKVRNGYWHIVDTKTENGEGWVKGLYLVDNEPDKPIFQRYVVVSKVRLASRNGVKGRRIKWLKNGTELIVYGVAGEWAVTSKGYVKIEYLEVDVE